MCLAANLARTLVFLQFQDLLGLVSNLERGVSTSPLIILFTYLVCRWVNEDVEKLAAGAGFRPGKGGENPSKSLGSPTVGVAVV